MEGETDLVLGLAASALSGLSSAYAGEFASRLSAQRCLAYLSPPNPCSCFTVGMLWYSTECGVPCSPAV